MLLDPVSLVIGLAIGGLLVGMILGSKNASLKAKIETERAGLDEHFSSLAQKALQSNTENFLTLAKEKLEQAQEGAKHDLDKRSDAIKALVDPVHKNLDQLKNAVEQIQGTDKALREDLKSLSKETSKLSGALSNPVTRGQWGEYILERLLDKANLIKGVHYESQVVLQTDQGSLRPDIIVHLQDGFDIVVDAKAPINEFVQKLEEDLTRDEIQDIEIRLSKQVRQHIKALSSKGYWEQLSSPDFVVLFLPSEHIFSAALRGDADLVDFAAENQIIIASPTLMISLLRVVGLSWRQVELAKNAQDIASLGAELYERIATFAGHMQKVGKNMEGALNSYNKAVSSLESRVMVSARRFKDMKAAPANKDLQEMQVIEASPRSLMNLEQEEHGESVSEQDNMQVANK